MKFRLTELLVREIRQYQLRSACPDCFFFVAAEERCAHEWPNAMQIGLADQQSVADGGEIEFCKEFELV